MSESEPSLSAAIELGDGIHVLRGGGAERGWNGIRYQTGLSGKNVGSRELSMNVATIPAGGVAFAHIHVDFEVMLYILAGRVRHEFGDTAESPSTMRRATSSSSKPECRMRCST